MKKIFKVKDAKKTVRDVFLNGLKQTNKGDYELKNNSIKFFIGLKKNENLTYTQETTIIV